jgi:hypothetical protein
MSQQESNGFQRGTRLSRFMDGIVSEWLGRPGIDEQGLGPSRSLSKAQYRLPLTTARELSKEFTSVAHTKHRKWRLLAGPLAGSGRHSTAEAFRLRLEHLRSGVESSPLLTGLSVAEKEVRIPFGKALFRTRQRGIEFHLGVRNCFGRDLTAKIRNHLVRTSTQTAHDSRKSETIKRRCVGLTD